MNLMENKNCFGWKSQDPTQANNYLLPAILKLIPNEKPLSILDAGCGNGFIAGELSRLGHTVIGIDIANDGIDIAKNAYPDVQFETWSVYEDFLNITKPVDVLVSTEVIEHLLFPTKFLLNAFNIIKPGGLIILSTPYHGYMKNLAVSLVDGWDKHHDVLREGGHIKFFSMKTLALILEGVGFSSIKFKNVGRVQYFWKSMVCQAKKNI